MYLITLMRKDFRQQRRFLAGAILFLLTPYAFSVVLFILNPASRWSDHLGIAAVCALGLAFVLIPFFAGNAVASERADRSAEFLAFLPIARGPSILSKALVAGAISAGMVAACWAATSVINSEPSNLSGAQSFAMVSTSLMMFGTAWGVSSFGRSPVFAAAAGLVLPACWALTRWLASEHGHSISLTAYSAVAFVSGCAAFVGGSIYCLRRVEP
jgi:ABC-type transport system involved in multi-copper enzyme maturation permease subunit